MNIKRYFYSGIQKAAEFRRKNIGGISVLMFHQVNDDYKEWKDPNVSIGLSSFAELIDGILSKGCEIIPVDSMEERFSEKAVVLTFDDIFEDAFLYAFPYLYLNHIPFTVFVAEELVGKESYISKSQLESLSRIPECTIGFHSKSHGFFRNLSKEEACSELDADGVEAMCGKRIKYFAFPYGSYFACGIKQRKLMENAYRYKYSFSTVRSKCSLKMIKSRHFLPRINVCEKNRTRILDSL